MDDSFARTNTGMMPYLVAASQVLGVASLAITGAWLSQYRGGFTWAGPEQFNVHPLCTVLGMVFLFGDAMLVFRVFRHETKKSTKILHSVLNILALIITVVGMIAVFQNHNKTQTPHLFSLHGWLGMVTFVLFILQWIVSFIIFFLPGVSSAIKGFFKPLHVFIGISLLVGAIATCLLGFSEKIMFSLPNQYFNLPPEGILVNVLGMVLVAFGLVITYILIRDDWKRPPLPEEQALSIDFKTLTQGESPTEP